MTTTVTVQAHCAEHIEVLVTEEYKNSPGGNFRIVRLNDGDTYTGYAYDDKVISVKEQPKALWSKPE